MKQAIGELVTCTRCIGTWIGAGLASTQILAPRTGRLLTAVLAAGAVNDFLLAGFAALTREGERARAAAAGLAARPRSQLRCACGRRRSAQRDRRRRRRYRTRRCARRRAPLVTMRVGESNAAARAGRSVSLQEVHELAGRRVPEPGGRGAAGDDPAPVRAERRVEDACRSARGGREADSPVRASQMRASPSLLAVTTRVPSRDTSTESTRPAPVSVTVNSTPLEGSRRTRRGRRARIECRPRSRQSREPAASGGCNCASQVRTVPSSLAVASPVAGEENGTGDRVLVARRRRARGAPVSTFQVAGGLVAARRQRRVLVRAEARAAHLVPVQRHDRYLSTAAARSRRGRCRRCSAVTSSRERRLNATSKMRLSLAPRHTCSRRRPDAPRRSRRRPRRRLRSATRSG